MTRCLLAALAMSACQPQPLGEDWQDWYGDGETYEVQEPVAFTADPYDLPDMGQDDIADVRAEVLTSPFDNDGPVFPPNSGADEGTSGCAFWSEQSDEVTNPLPRRITGVVTAHPRVYRKIEGCNGDEKYYGSYYIEDASGGVFVLGDSKVAHFDMGDIVTLDVRAMRRRYAIDMVYVHDVVDIQRGPTPIHFETSDRPLSVADQSTTKRVSGVVVTEPTTFGEVLVQIDGYDRTCAPDDERTRANCLFVTIDQETARRGVTLKPGQHIQVTGPVSQSAWFGPTGVFNFYGIYVMRVGQITWLDGSR